MQNILMDIISSITNAFMAILFVSYFNSDKIRFSKKECLFTVIIFIGNLCGNFLDDFFYSLIGYNLITFLIIIIITLIITSIYSLFDNKNTDIFKKVISPFIFLCAFIISNTISAMIVAIIFKDTLEGAFNAKYFEKFVFIVINLSILIIILLISIKFHKKLNTKKMLYLLIPLPFVSSIALLLFSEIKKVESIYQFYYITEIYYSTVIIISAFATFGIYFLLYQTHLKNQIEKEKELYENMLKIENKRYEDLKNNTEQIQKIRHDIKNMLFSVKTELNANNFHVANQKLDSILDNVSSFKNIIQSNNRTINYIVNAKLGNIQHRKIAVYGDISGMENINDIDIAIILGNILDNAIEATEDIPNADITLKFFVKGNYQNVICENTIKQPVLKKNPNLTTTKKDSNGHGLGIRSIKEVVKNYHGIIDFFEKQDSFCIHIMIPITTLKA